MREYGVKNSQKIKIRMSFYQLNHKAAIRISKNKRKNILNKFTKINKSEFDNILNIHDNKCHYCGILVLRGINLHFDHKIPLSKSGDHSVDNIVPACMNCNLRKSTKTDLEFFELLAAEKK